MAVTAGGAPGTTTITATLLSGTTQAVTLQQIGPGQYSGEFTPLVEGAYLIRVAGNDPANAGAEAVAQTAGWVLSYSPEYRSLESDPNFLIRAFGFAPCARSAFTNSTMLGRTM